MKRLLIIMSAISFMFADEAVGNWKLSGLIVDYYDIARPHPDYPNGVPFLLKDSYGYGIEVEVANVPAGLMFNRTLRGPWGDAALQAAGINLNVNLYPDGTGVVGEGSYYPDVDLIPGTCITTGQIFPITDSFNWEDGQETVFPSVNMIGLPSMNVRAGQTAYGLGVNGSSVFDNWTATPQQIPTPSALTSGIYLSDGTVLSNPASVGGVTAGEWGGYYISGDDLGPSTMGTNDFDINFMLVWNAIDGPESESGIGDLLGEDEDGDGTDFDRIFGVPYLSATYINNTNPLCDITGGAGLMYPVAGDIVDALGGSEALAALLTGSCLASTSAGVYDGCLASVQAGVVDGCEAVGGVANMIYGQCVEQANGDDFAAGCAYAGVTAAVTQACVDAGGPATAEEAAALGENVPTCGDLAAQYEAGSGGDCAAAAALASATCEDSNDLSLCCFAGSIANASTDTDGDGVGECSALAAGFSEEFLDASAAASEATGFQTCTELSAGLAAGLAAGDATAIAQLDASAAAVIGMSCSDYGSGYEDMCIESVAGANDMYLMDPSLTDYGLFMTFNAASFQQYLGSVNPSTGELFTAEEVATLFPELLVNDSSYDFDPTCYATGETCGGRLVMNFEPTCVPEVEGHEIVAEFVDLNALGCTGTGDVAGGWDELPCVPTALNEDGTLCVCDLDSFGACSAAAGDDLAAVAACSDDFLCYDGVQIEEYEGPAGDGVVNVVHIVKLVGHVLGTSPLGGYLLCEADLNGDDIINVVDVVAMVNIALNGAGSVSNDATEATIINDGSTVSVEADGHIGAIDMVVEFTGEFNIQIDDRFLGGMTTDGNTAHIVLVGLNKDEAVKQSVTGNIFSYDGEIISISQEMANSRELINNVTFSEAVPSAYEISNAYPNPFNPSTSFEMRLDQASDVTVKIYNLTGQLVDVIAEGNFSADTHTFTWNADNLASGVYFISTQVNNSIENQKVMLIK